MGKESIILQDCRQFELHLIMELLLILQGKTRQIPVLSWLQCTDAWILYRKEGNFMENHKNPLKKMGSVVLAGAEDEKIDES